MLGMIFTEFCTMVEAEYSADMLDDVIEMSDLPSAGAYTSVGNYSHKEMLSLVSSLSSITGKPAPALVRSFGLHLFAFFTSHYPVFFEGIESSFDFMKTIDSHIHHEVRKLYPDAAPPTFELRSVEDKVAILTYRSKRPFADLAEGLIYGCADHFGEKITLKRENLDNGDVRFTATLV